MSAAPDPHRAELMARIRKLLALAGSPNPHEAAAALAKARALMDAHQVSQGDLALAEIAQARAEEWRSKPREKPYRVVLLSVVGEIFGCRLVIDDRPVFYGRHPELAVYASTSLLRLLESARTRFGVAHFPVTSRTLDEYAFGWVIGVQQAAESLLPEKDQRFERALARYAEERFDGFENRTVGGRIHSAAGVHGLRDGAQVNLSRPMSGGAPRAQIGAA